MNTKKLEVALTMSKDLFHGSMIFEVRARKFLRSRWALSTIVTTLIILVISVLLAASVVYLAINVTGTHSQEENLVILKRHVWYNNDGTSEAAVLIVNSGGRDVVIQKVNVRGQTLTWSASFYYKGSFSLSDMNYIGNLAEGSFTPISDGFGSFERFIAAQGPLTLSSGESMLFYVINPDSITVNDIGTTVGINIYTSQAVYYKEANVETPINAGGS